MNLRLAKEDLVVLKNTVRFNKMLQSPLSYFTVQDGIRRMLKAKWLLNSIISKEVKTSRSVWNSVASGYG